MDIRDITTVPLPNKGETFVSIFKLQKDLLEEYLKIEKFRPWPWDIDIPEDQKAIKDFIARVVEELGEGYESYLKVYWAYVNNSLTRELIINNIFNLNEEIADALHFMMELFIVTDITHKDLVEWGISFNFPDIAIEDYNNLYTIFDNTTPLNTTTTPEVVLPELSGLGGLEISNKQLVNLSKWCWEVTYHLQLARNTLKNKPWKQTHMRSDKRVFVTEMGYALRSFISLTKSIGINEQNLYSLYYKKNMINKFRIQSKY